MKIIVTGGRDYQDQGHVFDALDQLDREHEITVVVHGDARGADRLARDWAEERGVEHIPYPADWKNLEAPGAVIRSGRFGPYNVLAGFQRNQKMVDEHPDGHLVAFPGGNGTADMKERARAANIPLLFES